MQVGAQNKWHVIAVVILKDEAPYIESWLRFHISLGFEHFIIYDNNSSDNIGAVLSKYIAGGVVTYIGWPARAGQIDAYNHALSLFGTNSEWIGFFDVDEYVVLHVHETVGSFVSSFDADQILLPWRNFPYGGHKVTPGGSDIENYFWAYRVSPNTGVQVKHFVRPAAAVRATAHFSFITTDRTVIADGTQTELTHVIYNPSYRIAQLNHYSTRSYQENASRLAKGQVDGGAEKQLATFIPLNADTATQLEYDGSALRHFSNFRRECEKWSSLAVKPHRFGLMQRRPLLSSWNNVPYFFCKSFLNYLAGASEIAHGTELEPVYVDVHGGERRLRSFWTNSDLTSVHFRVDGRSFIPFFLGSVHYGDFVRRFDFTSRFTTREVNVKDTWSITVTSSKACLTVIFDVKSAGGLQITASTSCGQVIEYSVPAGEHAGILYVPKYLFDCVEVSLSIVGECIVRELIIGMLP